jgi:hypothetical protein
MDSIRTTDAIVPPAAPKRRPAPLWPTVLAAWIGSAAASPAAPGLTSPAKPGEARPPL